MKTKQSFFHALKGTGVRLLSAAEARPLSVVEVRLPSIVEARSLSAVEALSFALILLSFVLFLSSCQRSTAPVYNPQKLQLTVADVSCTEAWLQLRTEETEKAEKELTLEIFRDDSLVVNKNWGAGDSLIYIEGLQPNTAYAFCAKLLQDNKLLAASPKVTATTMDTTSHDFTWQTFEFGGQGGSSAFYDVAIIDENDIWAVGEIYTADDKYNAAHWNGEKWELKKIDWDGYVSRLTCVFAFSSNDVWFGVTNLIHWNGNRFEKNINPVLNQFYSKTVNKIWGTSDNDLYIVGNDGLIAHYNGRQWQRIESGTTTQIRDIWGYVNPTSGIKKVLCAVSNVITLGDNKILEINSDNSTNEIPWDTGSTDKRVNSIWFNNIHQIYACGGGVFISKNGIWEEQPLPAIHTNRIRGMEINDIFVAGDFGLIAHFNGLSWKVYPNANVALSYSLSYKGNILTAVGERSGKAVILKMRRE